MNLLSAAEDFSCNTLAAVPGVWGKLRYISGLKHAEGGYEHWGMTRKYGRNAVQGAISNAHRELILEVLRTPLRHLLEETEKAANRDDISPKEYVNQLAANVGVLLPPQIGGESVRHFTTVLESLSSLVRGYTGASRRVS